VTHRSAILDHFDQVQTSLNSANESLDQYQAMGESLSGLIHRYEGITERMKALERDLEMLQL